MMLSALKSAPGPIAPDHASEPGKPSAIVREGARDGGNNVTEKTIDVLIADQWPDRWLRANDPAMPYRAKARNRLRKEWRDHETLVLMMATNPAAKCANCRSYEIDRDDDHLCTLRSDWRTAGHIVEPDHCCLKFHPSEQPLNKDQTS